MLGRSGFFWQADGKRADRPSAISRNVYFFTAPLYGCPGRVSTALSAALAESRHHRFGRLRDLTERSRGKFSTFEHRNVCRMYDLGKAEGTHFITMEYVPGENLRSMIRMSGQLGFGTAIAISRKVCEGLTEAHRLGIVHRDLKPSNIMIDREGTVRVLDFGIARTMKGKGITGPGVVVGTPEYMSPEQVEGKDAGESSDIYSLGVIIYEMVTGRVPFEGETPFVIGVKHKSEIPRDPKEFNSQIPEGLTRLILTSLQKDTEKRFPSAADV